MAVGPFWYTHDRIAAWSVSIGSPVGAHVTVRLPAKLDISGVVSVNGGFEGILQRRLLFTEYVGLSAGYRSKLSSIRSTLPRIILMSPLVNGVGRQTNHSFLIQSAIEQTEFSMSEARSVRFCEPSCLPCTRIHSNPECCGLE